MNDVQAILSLTLRHDIEMRPAMPDADGSPGWILHDPLQHRYFRIDEATQSLFALWQSQGTLGAALQAYSNETGLDVGEDQVQTLVKFVTTGNLVEDHSSGSWRELSERASVSQTSWFKRLAHQYLFFKVPLVHPQAALEATLPYVRILLTRGAAIAFGCIALIGLYLVSRQWDGFLSSMSAALTPQGALGFAIALVLLKAAHELGHAYMAVKYGCRVSVLGVAFMMLTPLLYSDVSDAWTLPSRRKRLMISGAGILVELSLAAVATGLWVFLPDGTIRSIAFMIATTAWVMSLAINLNPFMRFDGYYLLADWLGVDNLQPRAFALGRWKIRQWLLAPDMAPPETLPRRLQTGLILYAWVTWAYRLVLFTTIALMVYHFTFKLLGIVLFCLEIGLLLLAPIIVEIKEWRKIAQSRSISPRLKWAVLVASLLFVLAAIPLPSRITVPAVLVAKDLTQIYTDRAAQIASVDTARLANLEAGAALFHLTVSQIESDIEATAIRRDMKKARLGHAVSDEEALQQSLVLREELSSLQTKLSGLKDLKNDLVLRTPIKGTVLQIAPNLHAGRWVKRGELLALVSSGEAQAVQGYISEADLQRLSPNARGRFIPDDLHLSAFDVSVVQVAPANSPTIDIAELASVHDGQIVVALDANKKLVPQNTHYRIDLAPDALSFNPHQIIRGLVYLEGQPESHLMSALRQISRIVIRESGF